MNMDIFRLLPNRSELKIWRRFFGRVFQKPEGVKGGGLLNRRGRKIQACGGGGVGTVAVGQKRMLFSRAGGGGVGHWMSYPVQIR